MLMVLRRHKIDDRNLQLDRIFASDQTGRVLNTIRRVLEPIP